MSFLRHRKSIFRSSGRGPVGDRIHLHRLDEFPAGYSLAGCSPAEPASASPTGHQYALIRSCRSSSFQRTVNCALTVCVRPGGKRTMPLSREAHLVPPAMLSVGFDDRNLFGTARSLSVTDDHTRIGHGGSFALTDPWLFGRDVVGGLRVSRIAGNQMQRASIRHRELSAADPWRVELVVNRQRFGSLGDSVATRRALLVARSSGASSAAPRARSPFPISALSSTAPNFRCLAVQT